MPSATVCYACLCDCVFRQAVELCVCPSACLYHRFCIALSAIASIVQVEEVNAIEPGLMQDAERFFVLTQTDNLWKEHLQAIKFLQQVGPAGRLLCICCLNMHHRLHSDHTAYFGRGCLHHLLCVSTGCLLRICCLSVRHRLHSDHTAYCGRGCLHHFLCVSTGCLHA